MSEIVCITTAFRYEGNVKVYIEPNLPPHGWGVRGDYPIAEKVVDANGEPRCRWCLGPLERPRRTWCSEECIGEALLRRNWSTLAGRIYTRDNGTCQECGKKYGVQEVDHIIAVRDGGTDDPDNLRLLCEPCHRAVTAQQQKRWAWERRHQVSGQTELFEEMAT